MVFHHADEDGDTAFHFACKSKKRSKELINLLINSSDRLGLDIEKVNNDGETGFDCLPRALQESLRAKRPRLE